jgi:predicted DNA-binding ribbon-helix-helix protein
MARATNRDGLLPGRYTRIRLDITSWDALYDIARRKGCSVRELIAEIDREREEPNLSAAIRSYVVEYYRESARRTPDVMRQPDMTSIRCNCGEDRANA